MFLTLLKDGRKGKVRPIDYWYVLHYIYLCPIVLFSYGTGASGMQLISRGDWRKPLWLTRAELQQLTAQMPTPVRSEVEKQKRLHS